MASNFLSYFSKKDKAPDSESGEKNERVSVHHDHDIQMNADELESDSDSSSDNQTNEMETSTPGRRRHSDSSECESVEVVEHEEKADGKTKKKRKVEKVNVKKRRNYRTAWEKTFPWVKKSDAREMAYCKICRKSIQPRKATLYTHQKSQQHKDNFASIKYTEKISSKTFAKSSEDQRKIAEIELAVNVACHSAVLSIDHIGELIKRNGGSSVWGSIGIHRTKCTKLITNVIAPSLIRRDREDTKDILGYTIMVDETTDTSCDKIVAFLMKYYSANDNEIKTVLLGMKKVISTTGEDLFEALSSQLEESGLDISRMTGYASDGASNMVGENNSLWSRIKQAARNCVMLKCICHSLALCVSHAFDKLPSSIAYISRETPKWFRKSTLRRDQFKKIYDVMNDEEPAEAETPFQKLSDTRWLVRGKVMSKILANWHELKAYFDCAANAGTNDARLKARLLRDMFSDDLNRCIFHFAVPVIQEFERMNSYFQSSEDKDPVDVTRQLETFHLALKRRVYTTENHEKPVHLIDYGCKFKQELAKFSEKSLENQMGADNARDRCKDMLKELIVQVTARLPDSDKQHVSRSLKPLSPGIILNHTKRKSIDQLPHQHLINDAIEDQYRRIVCHDWEQETDFDISAIDLETKTFWLKVRNNIDEYAELAQYALTALASPLSNAAVERLFSVVNATKTKARNRMNLHTLFSIVKIKCATNTLQNCCLSFRRFIDSHMLQIFTNEMYEN